MTTSLELVLGEIPEIAQWRAERDALAAALAEAKEQRDESDAVLDRLSKILAESIVILRGPEPPLTRWSYHDIPQRIAAEKARAAALESENERLMSLCQQWSEGCTGRHGSQSQCVDSSREPAAAGAGHVSHLTRCWNCLHEYFNDKSECKLCGAANANLDRGRAERERSMVHHSTLAQANTKLRDKLLELANECAGCGGTGVQDVTLQIRGNQVERQVPCTDCEDIRQVLA